MKGSKWLGVVGLAVLLGGAGAVEGQRFTLDGEVVGGSVSLAWGRSEASAMGVGLGVTVPQFNQTISPDTDRWEEFLHVSGFYRRRAGAFEADLGMRLGIADLYECGASDCWPGYFVGPYAEAYVGWEHVKFGARLVAGSQKESGEPRTFVLNVTPFLVRIAFGR